MKNILVLFLALLAIPALAAKPKPKFEYVKITTDKGECIIRLYNETPLHRDNFVKLTKEGFFNGTTFHRVIKAFMIQGGDPFTKEVKPDSSGKGDIKYLIPAEFRDSLFHKKGALAAARTNNPEKASSGSQFYIVQGKTFTDSALSVVETKRLNFRLPEYQREVYKTIGGTPHLDRNYTVFGEVVKGLEMVDNIAAVTTEKGDKPTIDIRMTVTLLTKREVKKLEKELAKQAKKELLLAKK